MKTSSIFFSGTYLSSDLLSSQSSLFKEFSLPLKDIQLGYYHVILSFLLHIISLTLNPLFAYKFNGAY